MKTHIEFRSSAFPAYPGEEEKINPGVYGKRLAEFLAAALGRAGFEADEPGTEDWGCYINIKNVEFALWVGCGNYQEYEDGFLCFIEPSRPVVRRWFRKISTEEAVARVAAALEAALREHPDVHSLRWWSEEESASRGA